VVDTGGRLLVVEVHAADISDTEGGKSAIRKLLARYPTIRKIWVDQGYKQGLVDWAREAYGIEVEVVGREPGAKGFVVEPRRWVVERSLAWYGRNRRLARDYETLAASAEAFVYIASVRQLLNRVAPAHNKRKPYRLAA
jgi:transposase